MDGTLGQILSYLFLLQAEVERLTMERDALKRALEAREEEGGPKIVPPTTKTAV